MSIASLPYHLAQLASLCRTHPADEKVVFVPSQQIGYNLGTALAVRGAPWVNLRMTTPADWADRLVGAAFRSEGLRPLVQDADAFFILASVRNEPWPEDHPFARGFSTPGFARTLLKTIRALRLAGIQPVEISSTEVGSDDLLRRQYAAYCTWLEEQRFYDRADSYRRATLVGSGEEAVFAIFDETPLPQCAYEFVKACSGGHIVRIGRETCGAPLPEHSAGKRFAEAPLIPEDEAIAPGGHLQTGGLSAADRSRMALRGAVGSENEIHGALRELLSEGRLLDEIEIAYTSERPYLSLLVEETDRLDLPATFAGGVPVTYTRPGQALLSFLRWMASGYDPAELVRLFRSRSIYLPAGDGLSDVSAIGGMLLEARLGSGRHAWRDPFERYIDRIDQRIHAGGSEGGHRFLTYQRTTADRVQRHLEKLYGLCPSEETSQLAIMATSARGFLETFAAWEGDRDQRARESLSDRLRDLGDGANVSGQSDEIASMLGELIQEHKIEAAVARAGCIYVVPLERAGYSGRRELVIVGMAETTFPGPALEDPILVDSARQRFNGRLRLQRTRAGDPASHLVRAMGMASGRVMLTANGRDTIDGREIYPSALFEQARELLELEDVPVYAPVPESEVALTDAEVVMSLRGDRGMEDMVTDEFPWLLNGRIAADARTAPGLSIYDGWLAQSVPDVATGVLSASRLEDLAACPYRYFLKNVLDVRPPDISNPLPGRWLTPLEFGLLLHGVLRSFMEQIAERGESVDTDVHASLMDEVLEAEVTRYREEIPVQFDAGYQADVRRLQRTVRVFLAEESRREAHPIGFEVSFGMGRTGTLDVPEPVELELYNGTTVSLRGSIDRVDRTERGYEVWDYKTSSAYNFDEEDLLSGGCRLQWALYAYVLEDLLQRSGIDAPVDRSGYFFTSDREHGLRLSDAPPARDELANRIKPLFDLVANGAFVKVQKKNACTFCDYAEVCAPERKGEKDMDDIVGAALPEHDFMEALEDWMDYSI